MLFGENKYGKYCVPSSSTHRPAAKVILTGEVYEPDTIELVVERARGRGDIVHAGTYFGDFLPALCKAGVHVWAFEPSRDNWLHAVGTLYLNALTDVDVTCVALGEASYPAKVVSRDTDTQLPLGGSSFVTTTSSGNHDCVVRPLDSMLPRNTKVAVIQLDVEYYEEKVLVGALLTIKRCKPTLILETVPEQWVTENLIPLGYKKTGRVHYNTVFEVA